MLFKLAFRNIWRNRRRTLITAASVCFAVFFAICMQSIQTGAWDNMVNSIVQYHTGYLQIHQKGFWDEQSIDKSIDPKPVLRQIDSTDTTGFEVLPRLESFALASYEQKTKGVLVIGIDPGLEDDMTQLKKRISEGQYYDSIQNGAILSSGLAEHLGMGVGDTLVLISQGYRGSNAAGKFPIRGIASLNSPDLDERLVYLPLDRAQYFFRTGPLVTSLVVDANRLDRVDEVKKQLTAALDTSIYEVMDYKELMPDLLEAKSLDTAGSYIIMIVLYIIISFGIFGTLLMMIRERAYEFGVLIAIGMKRFQLFFVLWLEFIFISFIGVLAGMGLALPVVAYFQQHPIRLSGSMAEAYNAFGFEPVFPAVIEPEIFLTHGVVIFFIVTLMTVYPYFEIKNLKAVHSMREN